MKRIIFQLTKTLIALALIPACKPEPLELNIKQAPEKLCIANQYAGDGIMGVVLSHSFSALNQPVKPGTDENTGEILIDTSLLISGAEITLSGGGISLPITQVETGIYGTESFLLQDGVTYTISVNHPQWGKIQSSAVKMERVNFDSIYWKTDKVSQKGTLYFSFHDNPDQFNYYLVNYFIPKKNEPIPNKPDPEYIVNRLLEQQATFDLITENDLENHKYSSTRKLTLPDTGDSLLVSLSNISKEYFDFLSAQKKAGTLFNQLRGEVVNFPGNISGGYGFFTLHEPDFRIVISEE